MSLPALEPVAPPKLTLPPIVASPAKKPSETSAPVEQPAPSTDYTEEFEYTVKFKDQLGRLSQIKLVYDLTLANKGRLWVAKANLKGALGSEEFDPYHHNASTLADAMIASAKEAVENSRSVKFSAKLKSRTITLITKQEQKSE